MENETTNPDEYGRHQKTFEAGFEPTGFTGFTDVVRADIERLANRVERPCRVVVNIEVYDLDNEARADYLDEVKDAESGDTIRYDEAKGEVENLSSGGDHGN